MPPEQHRFRTGDTVRYTPNGEVWTVAYVDGDYLVWCGWPHGQTLAAKCELVTACSDDEHIALLRQMAELGPDDARGRRAMRALGMPLPEDIVAAEKRVVVAAKVWDAAYTAIRRDDSRIVPEGRNMESAQDELRAAVAALRALETHG
jgi:hypothetical protein